MKRYILTIEVPDYADPKDGVLVGTDDTAAFANVLNIEEYDMVSSASRQHFIDTGRYLTVAEAEEAQA